MPSPQRHDQLRVRQLQLDVMKDKKIRNRRRRPERDPSEIGVVRVFSNPGPDAEDRPRRLFSLLVKYATRDGQAASEEDSPPGAPDAADHPEVED